MYVSVTVGTFIFARARVRCVADANRQNIACLSYSDDSYLVDQLPNLHHVMHLT
jgi:hypothetical protein